MTDMQFNDRSEISGFRKTADGYLVGDVLCARTGCQDYRASELGLMGDAIISVYRPESAVFAKDSLATYAGKPVTLGHPPVMVTADNWKEYAAGSVGGDIARDGEFVRVPTVLMDAATIAAVSDGTREISMGYTTPVEMIDGVAPDGTPYQAVQTGPIKINHLAIVPKARGGDKLRIGDSASNWGASPINDTGKQGGHMAELRKIMVDGLQVETTDAGAAAIEKLTKSLTDAVAAKDAALVDATAANAKADAATAAKDAAIAKADAAVMTDDALDARVADRAELIGKAKSVAKDVDTAGLSDAAIRKAAVVAALGDAAVDGKADAYIDARFDILVEDAATDDPVKAVKLEPQKVADIDAIYADRDTALVNAYKTKGAN